MPLILRRVHARADMYGLARHAEWYERRAARLGGPLYRRVVSDVVAAGLPAGAVVLDAGTGPGLVPRRIAATGADLHLEAVDLSEAMIARAAAASRREPGAERIRFQVADVAALPFDDGSVDLVISSISLHHWPDPHAGLREVVRVLRPGGRGWIYDFRPALRRPERLTCGLEADAHLETRLAGAFWLNPISRLVLRRRA